MDTDRSAHLGDDHASVVVTMTPLQAMSLAMLIARSHPGDPGLDALRRELSDAASEVGHQEPWEAATVFAAAEAVVAGAQIDIVAERRRRMSPMPRRRLRGQS